LDPVLSLIVVAFAGSGNTIRNWLTDFTFAQAQYSLTGCTSCYIHSGFSTGWSQRRLAVLSAVAAALDTYPNYALVITGHSVGAGIATLACAELRTLNYTADLYTYGSPRVGNTAFATFVTSQAPAMGGNYRMTHENDPVPQLPPTVTNLFLCSMTKAPL
jgi:predicted lipase